MTCNHRPIDLPPLDPSELVPYELPLDYNLIEEACPFCGAWLFAIHHEVDPKGRGHTCKIACLSCGASGPALFGVDLAELVPKIVKEWNERRPADAARDRYVRFMPRGDSDET